VAGQLALALVLLVGSGLMFRSFQELRRVDPGFDPGNVLTVGMSLGDGVANDEAAIFYRSVADEVAALPGVTRVGLTNALPVEDGAANGGSFYIESQPREEGALPPVAMYKSIGADYLGALNQPLLEGRGLERSDWESGPTVVLVNETFAKSFFEGRALGESIRWTGPQEEFAQIVGVVGDVREFGLSEEIRPMAYFPMVLAEWNHPELAHMSLTVRSQGAVAPSVDAVRGIIGRHNAGVPITSVQTMDEILSRDMAGTSFTMVLLGIAATVARRTMVNDVPASVVSYVVGQRTREIGVRVALGAHGRDIRNMVFRQGAGVALAGLTLGLLGAAALTRVMGALLFGVSATDPLSFVGAPLVLALVAVTATWLPARKAARVDPIEALRNE
jgi:putative ABC transport system permease protein